MSNADNLRKAKDARQDEFYTQLEDIERELKHYKEHFQGKTVLCNCDDPYESNFFKYFAMNFKHLGLKRLITTCYVSSPVMGTQLALFEDMQKEVVISSNSSKKPYKVEITDVSDENNDGAFDLDDIKNLLRNKKNVCTILKGDGDFRSEECISLLKESDIVVTNPPFSLFREFIAQLIEYKKDFIIIGNQNAITYKEIFPLLKNNKMWLGYGFQGGNAYFSIPSYNKAEYASGVYNPETGLVKFRNCAWFTNIDIEKRHEEMILYKPYKPNEYPQFDNYDAIEVSKIADIPFDYYGVMGVPITFLDKFNPDQFEILGYTAKDMGIECKKFYTDLEQSLNGGDFVRNMKSARFSPMIRLDSRPNKTCYRASNVEGYMIKTYGRILIRRKEQPT